MTWPTVCATGHRPQHLDASAAHWVKEKVTAGAVWLRDERGTKVGVSGMALGVDTWWAHAVLAAGLELHAYIPFESQPDRWTPSERAEWARLRGLATVVKVVGPNPRDRREAVRMLHARNDAMLAASDAAVAVLLAGKTDGGTASAVRKADRLGLPGVHLEPTARRVRVVEPGGWLDF
jgi:uncharacterized phage-like protein YoqJ